MSARAKRKLRIGIICQPEWGIFPGGTQGSLGIWSCEVGRELSRHCDVTLFAPRCDEQPSEEFWQGLRILRVPTGIDTRLLRRMSRNAKPDGPPPFARGSYYGLYGLRVAAALRAGGFDIAHVTNLSQFVPLIRLLAPRIRIILHMQCDWLATLDYQTIARRVRGADAVTGCSHYTANQARTRLGDACRHWGVLHNGVDVERFCPPTKPPPQGQAPRLLFIARVSPEKGLHVLLEAMALLGSRYPKLELDVIGARHACPRQYIVDRSTQPHVRALTRFYENGTYNEHLGALMDRHDLAGRVHFHGMLPHHELVAYHHRSNMLVAPSLWEPFGMMVAEGLATERPVVASKADGIVDIIEHGASGLLVTPGEAAAFADALDTVLADPTYARRLGRAGRQRVLEHFTWQHVAKNLLTLCQQVLHTGKPAAQAAAPAA